MQTSDGKLMLVYTCKHCKTQNTVHLTTIHPDEVIVVPGPFGGIFKYQGQCKYCFEWCEVKAS